MWEYFIDYDRAWLFSITSNRFIVQLTGGSVFILDRETTQELKRHKGHSYVYTGDISPDEKLCFALENEKYFLVYSLENYELKKRVTLPDGYTCTDMCGHFTEDGKYICIPGCKYIPYKHTIGGRYEYALFHYAVDTLTLVKKTPIKDREAYNFDNAGAWPLPEKSDAEKTQELVDWIMSLKS